LKDNSKFLATKPSNELLRTKKRTCAFDKNLQGHVTSRIAECIVDAFEMVEVSEQKRAPAQRLATANVRYQPRSVQCSGQLIGHGRPPKVVARSFFHHRKQPHDEGIVSTKSPASIRIAEIWLLENAKSRVRDVM
jgi:hypothetical protein